MLNAPSANEILSAVKSGPPSVANFSWTPNVEKSERKHAVTPRAPDQELPVVGVGIFQTNLISDHQLRGNGILRNQRIP